MNTLMSEVEFYLVKTKGVNGRRILSVFVIYILIQYGGLNRDYRLEAQVQWHVGCLILNMVKEILVEVTIYNEQCIYHKPKTFK